MLTFVNDYVATPHQTCLATLRDHAFTLSERINEGKKITPAPTNRSEAFYWSRTRAGLLVSVPHDKKAAFFHCCCSAKGIQLAQSCLKTSPPPCIFSQPWGSSIYHCVKTDLSALQLSAQQTTSSWRAWTLHPLEPSFLHLVWEQKSANAPTQEPCTVAYPEHAQMENPSHSNLQKVNDHLHLWASTSGTSTIMTIHFG